MIGATPRWIQNGHARGDKSQDPPKNHAALDAFLVPHESVDCDENAAQVYGKIRVDLERCGTPIGSLNILIAAHCLS